MERSDGYNLVERVHGIPAYQLFRHFPEKRVSMLHNIVPERINIFPTIEREIFDANQTPTSLSIDVPEASWAKFHRLGPKKHPHFAGLRLYAYPSSKIEPLLGEYLNSKTRVALLNIKPSGLPNDDANGPTNVDFEWVDYPPKATLPFEFKILQYSEDGRGIRTVREWRKDAAFSLSLSLASGKFIEFMIRDADEKKVIRGQRKVSLVPK